MPRYFLEVAYKGTNYAGFQVQQNANTVQAELEKALQIYFRAVFELTGSSRTDSGVHAKQNYFHFDFSGQELQDWQKAVYHLNAILPGDIVVKHVVEVASDAHCRFDATARTYEYSIYQSKDPFLADRSYYFPYKLDLQLLNEAALLVKEYTNFETFSKRNTQVKTFQCELRKSEWRNQGNTIIYRVSGNRFLRGMVRGLTGTMLKVGMGKTSIAAFKNIIESRDATMADFSVPPHGLMLMEVSFDIK